MSTRLELQAQLASFSLGKAEDYATQIDGLKQTLATVLTELQKHDPEFVKRYLVPDTSPPGNPAAMVPASEVEHSPSPAE